MLNSVNFLSDISSRPWSPDITQDFSAKGLLFVGRGASAIEVVVTRSPRELNQNILLKIWKSRQGNRASPVLLVVLHQGKATLCGASGDKPPIYTNRDIDLIERLCREVLNQPDRHSALRFLSHVLPSLETTLPGINNEGLLALHELLYGVPKREDWSRVKSKASRVVGERNVQLLRALGFEIEPLDNLTKILRGGTHRTALAIILLEEELPEAGNARFNSLSPVSYALNKADDENLDWVVLVQGDRLRIYSTSITAGVGQRGRTETYIECYPSLLSDEHLPYLWLLCSAYALVPDGSLSQILQYSKRFSGDLADKLRDRIYNNVVPALAKGITTAQKVDNPSPKDLDRIYEMALTILFRLLFVAYAEDCDLLPYQSNQAYKRRSLKQKAQDLANLIANDTPVAEGSFHWQEVMSLWQGIRCGNAEWGIPAYDGGLFSDDPDISSSGASLASITLTNDMFENALRKLLVIETPDGVLGPVDFRSLSVREFGTIYEGLLASGMAVARTDLTLKKIKKEFVYVPAEDGSTISVSEGEVYLHNRSGARKSSGSYYTKSFAVDHLIDGALEPALSDHFNRLDCMNDTDASEAFFDFRVADIAMGSGHFLVGAIDRIEKRMTNYLSRRNLPAVRKKLSDLRCAAITELEKKTGNPVGIEIEDGSLLRRLIARHCIYGVDLNGLSVQLTRLAVWIHTFVPGLPLSFLDHNLVNGNALIGIGTIDELKSIISEKFSRPLFPIDTERLLGPAAKPLKRLANVNDLTPQDIDVARRASKEAMEAINSTKVLFDLITTFIISDDSQLMNFLSEKLDDCLNDVQLPYEISIACQILDGLKVLHFPVVFPEVFLRKRSGFDVILGNPPWEKVKVESHNFWTLHSPGLRSLSQNQQKNEITRLKRERPDLEDLYISESKNMEQTREALVRNNYLGMGQGDPDLYKAFCWRFWHLTEQGDGRIGVVLPRSALISRGSADFRHKIFDKSADIDIITLKNKAGWVFDDVTPQYTIGLVCISHGNSTGKSIHLRGTFSSQEEFSNGTKKPAVVVSYNDVQKWNDAALLPMLPNQDSVGVLAQFCKAPRLDIKKIGGGWRARPDREMDATLQKEFMVFKKPAIVGAQDPIPNFMPPAKKT